MRGNCAASPPPAPTVVWEGPAKVSDGVLYRKGGFPSPLAEHLAPESGSARFQFVSPCPKGISADDAPKPQQLAVIFSMTGDQGFKYVQYVQCTVFGRVLPSLYVEGLVRC